MKRACKEAPMTVVLRTPAATAMRAGRTIAVDAMLLAARASAVLKGRAACLGATPSDVLRRWSQVFEDVA
jgi:hypothetical protein